MLLEKPGQMLNGLAAREFIIGGRIEFLPNDTVTTSLLDGIVKFQDRTYATNASNGLYFRI